MSGHHRETYGERAPDLTGPFPKPAAELGLSTPVGVVQDPTGRVWVADAGNNRLLVFDRSLDRVLGQVGSLGSEPGEFDLPFRLAHHPSQPRLFVTDLGNGRVQELAYGEADEGGVPVTVERTFGPGSDAFHPNGVAVREDEGGLTLFVADEFYHEDAADTRSRVVVFDGEGDQTGSFRSVTRPSDDPVGLYWPQGLDTGPEGNLLIANTGYGQQARAYGRPPYYANVVRCDRAGEGVPFPATGSPVLDDEFAIPRAVSYLPDEERIVVPDIGGGHLYAYSPAGDRRGEVPSVIAPDIETRRFGAPMAVAGYDPGDADPTGAIRGRVLVTEALDHAVSAYRLRFVAERKTRLATVDGCRRRPGQFDYASGSAIHRAPDGRVCWVGDGGNERAQHTAAGLDAPVSPASLTANRFPATVEAWAVGEETYLFAADYSADAGAFDDDRQIHCYRLVDGEPEHVVSFGGWGYFGGDVRLPRGMSVEPLDAGRCRLHVADSLNGRVASWVVNRRTATVEDHDTRGTFGHDAGEFWLPSDVVVGPDATYVADRSNDRLQYDAGDGWEVVGTAGYGDESGRFLLPTSLALADGYLFVVDLVNRAIKVFETLPAGGIPDEPVDSFGTFGGQTAGGDLWFPAMVSAAAHDDGVTVLLPDSVLNVVYRYEWTPP
ncbi:NHL repeat-containing protein [Haloarcula onubensis]|uniref:NHL repeat-containing protein n=1 Tax=Haloarcula onubensis TaxID=2950539 RepID=A0ABU2FKR3_9EURY|nr:NHL repeat-containing protein [Halomicroarcula sp. S3CR25-11]MDS0281315.1 NHL repeat-containing protein [Halomicroarcula sp. S3CR25-11]